MYYSEVSITASLQETNQVRTIKKITLVKVKYTDMAI